MEIRLKSETFIGDIDGESPVSGFADPTVSILGHLSQHAPIRGGWATPGNFRASRSEIVR